MIDATTTSIELRPDPVFVIGSPRSGTTALATALALHPDFWVSKESYFLHALLGDRRASDVWIQNQERVTPSWLRHEGVSREEFLAAVGAGFGALYASRSGGRRWIDHTPRYTTMVDDLADLFPGASFLHIVRDGREVVRSMSNFERVFDDEQRAAATHEIPAWTSDVAEACRTWARWTDHALDLEQRRPERVLRVVNHELSAEPAEGFVRIFAFLGCPPDPAPAERFGGTRLNTSFADVDHRGAGWDEFPRAARATFVEEAGEAMERAGFADPGELAAWAAG